jgi:hypothetical protein
MRTIRSAIIHCSASPWGNEKIIRKWHVDERGWSETGYHFIITNAQSDKKNNFKCLDGQICVGRPIERVGAHCRGHNQDSIGICLIGNKTFTDSQFFALLDLLNELKTKFPGLKVEPHNKYNKHKTCPNFDLKKVLSYEWRM